MEISYPLIGFLMSLAIVSTIALGIIWFLLDPLREAMENTGGNPIIAKFLTRIFMSGMVVVPTMLVCAANVWRGYDQDTGLTVIVQETMVVSTVGFSLMLLIAWMTVYAREEVKREDQRLKTKAETSFIIEPDTAPAST